MISDALSNSAFFSAIWKMFSWQMESTEIEADIEKDIKSNPVRASWKQIWKDQVAIRLMYCKSIYTRAAKQGF